MTQKTLIVEYLKENGSILPAKMAGYVFKGQILGSETSKRCREMRRAGILRSSAEGKFERFWLTEDPHSKLLLPSMTAQKFFQMFPIKAEVKTNSTLF